VQLLVLGEEEVLLEWVVQEQVTQVGLVELAQLPQSLAHP
jgi:hypothetical protein